MVSQLTIGKKLALGVTGFIVCMAILSLTSLWVTSSLGTSLDTAVNGTARKIELISGARHSFQEMKTVSQREQVAYAIAELQRRSPNGAQWDCPACHTASPASDTIHAIETSGSEVHQRSTELRGLITDPTTLTSLAVLDDGAARWLDSSRQYLTLAEGKHFEDAHAILRDQMFPVVEQTDKAADTLAVTERAELNDSNLQAKAAISRAHWAVSTVIVVNLAVAVLVLWVIFGITASLRQVAVELGAGARQTNDAAAQVSSSSQSLAAGSSQQAAALEETSTSSAHINVMAHQNTANSRSAADLMTSTEQHFAQTGQALDEMVAAMDDINAQSASIAKIIKVIDQIAFQTNILALNAAVEAARAGQAGSGFAVVAEEVRSLAQRSAKAAEDTAHLIADSIAKSEAGKVKVDQMAASLRAVTQQTTQVKTLVDDVSRGSIDQAREIEQITRSITQMETVTHQTAASAEQSAAAAQQLNAQSETLQSIVEQLTTMVGGDNVNSRR